MDTCRKIRCGMKLVIAVLVVALSVSTVSVARTDAASRLAKPKFKLTKREKKSATLKVSNSKGITGYRIYLKIGKKGKWKLHDFAFHSSKIKLTKLKPNKIYYVKLKAWRTKGRSIRLSKYSKTIKIGKYQTKSSTKSTSAPTSTPIPVPEDGAGSATGAAVTIPMPTLMPTPTSLPTP